MTNTTASGSSAVGGAGGPGSAGNNGTAGGASAVSIFSYAGSVNGQPVTGPVPLLDPPQGVPTLSEWGMIILSTLLTAAAIWRMRQGSMA